MSFKISQSDAIGKRVLELYAEAAQFGQEAAFHQGYVNLVERLTANPFEVGEISYRLKGGQPVHGAAKGPVSITFAIYEADRTVIIFRVFRLASRGE